MRDIPSGKEVFLKKIRILGIAPYAGMKDMMYNIAAEWDNIEFLAYEGDMEQGADIVRSIGAEHFDAIISRGGTEESIRKVTDVFVYGIVVTYYDVLSSMKLAENFNGKFAIVGFPAIADAARMLCEILQYDIHIEAILSREDAREIIDRLKEEGYSLIVGDVVSTRYASEIGLTSMLVTSGSESIRAAFDQVIRICQYYAHYKKENLLYQINQTVRKEQMLVFDEQQKLLFQSGGSDRAALETYAKRMLRNKKGGKEQRAIHEVNGKNFLMTLQMQPADGQTYYFFNAARLENVDEKSSSCIRSQNKEDIPGNFFSLFYNNSVHKGLRETAEKFSMADFPVLIKGEFGTGKDRMAELLYSHSRYCNFPCYIVDCDIATKEEIGKLITSRTSLFCGKNATFYFRHIAQLDPAQVRQLMVYCEKSGFYKRNRLLFSMIDKEGQEEGDSDIEQELKYRLGCLEIHLPSLRQRIDDIPSVSNLYINQFNMAHGNQISGIEPEAVSLLQGYSWPQNLRQLRHVLDEACVQTTATYISKETIHAILRKERFSDAPGLTKSGGLDLNRSLDEITYDIVCSVLASENMNRTKAAKRLGISRTTLWRILDQH